MLGLQMQFRHGFFSRFFKAATVQKEYVLETPICAILWSEGKQPPLVFTGDAFGSRTDVCTVNVGDSNSLSQFRAWLAITADNGVAI